jgi:hypothetical protein
VLCSGSYCGGSSPSFDFTAFHWRYYRVLTRLTGFFFLGGDAMATSSWCLWVNAESHQLQINMYNSLDQFVFSLCMGLSSGGRLECVGC